MLAYNARIATKSLKRNPLLTAIIIAGIALGICASTTFTTVRHMFARDPLPGKSSKLFYVRMDNWDPANAYPQGDFGPPNPRPLPRPGFAGGAAEMRSDDGPAGPNVTS